MKKHILSFICSVILCSVLLAGCDNEAVSNPTNSSETGETQPWETALGPVNIPKPSETKITEPTKTKPADTSTDANKPSRVIKWDKSKYRVFLERHVDDYDYERADVFLGFDYDQEYLNNLDIPETIKIEFLGESYEAVLDHFYLTNKQFSPLNPICFSYKDVSGNSFLIAEDGTVVGCNIEPASIDNENILTKDECVTAAEAFFDEHFKDVLNASDYKITSVEEEFTDTYTVSYRKYVGDIKTTDLIRIIINFNGTVQGFSWSRFTNISSNIDVSFFTMEEINQVFGYIIEFECARLGIENKYLDRTSYSEPELFVIDDGTICFWSTLTLPDNVPSAYPIPCSCKAFIKVIEPNNSN